MAYIYVVQMNIPAELEAEFNRLYDSEHLPSLSSVAGCHKVTRYQLEKSEDPKMQRYLTIYEVDSPAVVESEAWRKAREYGSWMTKIRPHMTEACRSFYKEN
jgi:Domain of unknown function (DUF4286)